jgi:ribonuclease HI
MTNRKRSTKQPTKKAHTTAGHAPTKGSRKYYAVLKGRSGIPSIYQSWNECKPQVHGFSGAIYKRFSSYADAQKFVSPDTAITRPINRNDDCNSDNDRKIDIRIITALSTSPCPITTDETTSSAVATTLVKPHSSSTTTQYHYHIQITFDGGSRGNPGTIAGAGAVVTLQQQQQSSSASPRITLRTYHVRQYLGIDHSIHPRKKNSGISNAVTCNQAEYNGIVIALRVAWNCFHEQQQKQKQRDDSAVAMVVLDSLSILGDSQLVINQLNDTWECKNTNLKKLYDLSKELLQQMKSVNTTSASSLRPPRITMEHVYRDRNKQADGMSFLLFVVGLALYSTPYLTKFPWCLLMFRSVYIFPKMYYIHINKYVYFSSTRQ